MSIMEKQAFVGVTPGETWRIARARIVLADTVVEGGLEITDGRIGRLTPGHDLPAGALDLGGDYLLPGMIELHTDNLEKHLVPRAGVLWPALPALLAHDAQLLAAGITTVLDALSLGDLEEDGTRIDTLAGALTAMDEGRTHGLLRCDHHLHLRCELSWPGLLDLLTPLASRADLRLLSLMDHTPGQRQYRDVSQYRRYYSRSGLTWTDEEFDAILDHRRAQQARYRADQLTRVLALAQRHGLVLASHDDTDEAHVQEALAAGAPICEFPTTLVAARAARRAGLRVVAGASNLVRGGSHSGNVAAIDLARDGCLDILSSDYMPASLLHGAFILHEQAGWSLPAAIRSVSDAPAAALGFADRGRIASGLRADLLRVRMHGVQPVVRSVWVNGRPML